MKEERTENAPDTSTGDRLSNTNATSSTSLNDQHNDLMQRLYSGSAMHPSVSSLPGYSANDAMSLQYAWYNAYLQQSLYAQQSSYLASYYAMLGQGHVSQTAVTDTGSGSKVKQPAAKVLDNAKYQAKAAMTNNKDKAARYEPYRRQSTSAPVSPMCSTTNTTPAPSVAASSLTSLYNPYATAIRNNANALPPAPLVPVAAVPDTPGSVHDEAPVDLSQKTQKLQFLNTLKQLLDRQDQRNSKAAADDVKTAVKQEVNFASQNQDLGCSRDGGGGGGRKIASNPRSIKGEPSAAAAAVPEANATNSTSHATSASRTPSAPHTSVAATCSSAGSVTSSSAGSSDTPIRQKQNLSSTQDKYAYIAVLRELFEKGHSRTSEQILAQQNGATTASALTNAEATAPASANSSVAFPIAADDRSSNAPQRNVNNCKTSDTAAAFTNVITHKRSHDCDETADRGDAKRRCGVMNNKPATSAQPGMLQVKEETPADGSSNDQATIEGNSHKDLASTESSPNGNVTKGELLNNDDVESEQQDSCTDDLIVRDNDYILQDSLNDMDSGDVTMDSTVSADVTVDTTVTTNTSSLTDDVDDTSSAEQSIVQTADAKTLLQL